MTIEGRHTVRLRASLLVVATFLLTMTGCATTGGGGRDASASEVVPPAAESLAAGDEAARRGDFRRALIHYTQAASVESSVDIWLRIGAASSRLDDSQRALDAYLRVIELEPTQIAALEGAGLASMALGDAVTAREYLNRVLQADSQRWRAHNALGTLDDEAGDHVSAIAHYEAALAVYPESPAVLNNLGYSRYLLKDLDQAARDLYAATQLDPDYDRAWANLALVYAHKGWYANAVDTLAEVADEAAAHNDVGFIAFERGDLEAAAELLEEAVRLSPVYFEMAQKNLAAVRGRMGGSIYLFSSHDSEIEDLLAEGSGSMVADDR